MKPAANVDGVALVGRLDFAMGPLGTLRAANLTPAGYLRTLPPVDRDVGPTYREAG